jgi:hypothetical protein
MNFEFLVSIIYIFSLIIVIHERTLHVLNLTLLCHIRYSLGGYQVGEPFIPPIIT